MNTKNNNAPSLQTELLKNKFSEEPQHLIMNAIHEHGIQDALISNKVKNNASFVFSTDIKTSQVTNQRQSGRCWIFAGCNFLRHHLEQKLNLTYFELSQGHLFFYDKLEKSNYFLQAIIDHIEEDKGDRNFHFFLSTPQQDGGQWDMFVSLVEKYGLVPKSAFKDTFHMRNSQHMNRMLNKKLRLFAADLKKNYAQNQDIAKLQTLKEGYMQDIYRYLVLSLGEPVEKFDFEYVDKDNQRHSYRDITPLYFYEKFVKEQAGVDLKDYISIINAPTQDKPYMQSYTVSYLGNVIGGRLVKYLNLDMTEFKKLARAQLESGETVWFGCDVGQWFSRIYGVMDLDLYAYEEAFKTTFHATKEDALDYGDSLMTHAMLLTGVDVKDDLTQRWKIENSWGEDAGEKGYHVMTDEWMDRFTYQIVVHQKFLTEAQKAAFAKDPTVLKPWDPMGSLALIK